MSTKQAIELAEERQATIDPFEMNPEEMAREIVDEVGGDEHQVKNYLYDRMWYRRGIQ